MKRSPIKGRAAEVANYARLGAPDTEIAQMLGVSPRSLVRNHGPSLIRGRAERRLKLRQKQTEIALGGNVSMLIWLGKNELGQMEPRAAVEHSGPGGTPLAANVHVYMPSNNR